MTPGAWIVLIIVLGMAVAIVITARRKRKSVKVILAPSRCKAKIRMVGGGKPWVEVRDTHDKLAMWINTRDMDTLCRQWQKARKR